MNDKSILVVDASFLTSCPNREKSIAHISRWVIHDACKVYILTSVTGVKFYNEKLGCNILSSIYFINLPNLYSKEYIGPAGIIFEFAFRIFASFFLRIPKHVRVIYTVTAVIVDPAVGLVIRAKLASARLFVTFDNHVPRPRDRPGSYFYNLIPYWSYVFTLQLLNNVDCIFAYLTHDNLNHLRSILRPRPRESILQFSNGLDLALIKSCKPSSQCQYDLIFLGRLHVAKGIFDILDVVARLNRAGHKIKAALVGPVEPPVMTAVVDFISLNNIAGCVDILGYIPIRAKYEVLKASKLFVFLSYDDSFPIAILEAIACGLPIVAYDLPIFSNPPYVDADLVFFPKGDVSQVADCISRFLYNDVIVSRRLSLKKNSQPYIFNYVDNADKEVAAFFPARRNVV